MKVLLTGAHGNLGSSLVFYLVESGHQIVSVFRENWKDIETLMVGVDMVIHAAYDLKSDAAIFPEDYIDANLLTTAKLLEVMRERAVERMFFVSSCAVYGDSMSTVEQCRCVPLNINGHIKLLNESLIRSFCVKNSMQFTMLRVFNTYGGHDRFSILHKLRLAAEGKILFKLNNGGVSQRDFIHVDDVAQVMVTLISRFPSEDILNIGTGRSVRVSDLLDVVRSRHPAIEVTKVFQPEVEYSRADNSLLMKYVQHDFKSVLKHASEI